MDAAVCISLPARKKRRNANTFPVAIWLFVATLAVSLAFDYIDVVRYLLGEGGSMGNQ